MPNARRSARWNALSARVLVRLESLTYMYVSLSRLIALAEGQSLEIGHFDEEPCPAREDRHTLSQREDPSSRS